MGRIIGGVIAGYVAMFIVVFLGLTGAYLALGSEGAFQPGSFAVSGTWLMAMFAISLIAALAGGAVCGRIAAETQAPLFLAGLVVVLGLLSAIPAFTAGPPPPRTSDVPNLEAMSQARQPIWVALLLPAIGAVGAVAGARMVSPGAHRSAPPPLG